MARAFDRSGRWYLRVVLVLIALLVAMPEQARASNDDSYFVDSDAAMCAGAVVASSTGPGSVWYNPAGLGFVQRSHFNLSLSAGALQRSKFERAVSIEQADGSVLYQPANGTRVAMVSPGVAYVFKLRALTVGGGLFTTHDDAFRLAGESSYEDADGRRSFVLTRIDSTTTRYHLGGALGLLVAKGLSLGVSLFGVYESSNNQAAIALTSRNRSEMGLYDAAASVLVRDDASRFGAQASVGLSYRPLPAWSFGLHVRTPLLLLHESADASTLTQVSAFDAGSEDGMGPGSNGNDYQPRVRKTADVGLLAPARVTLGAAYRVGRVLLSAELDYLHPLRALDVRLRPEDDAQWLVDRRTVINGRVGALVALGDQLELGAGAFTDRSPQRSLDGPPDARVHYYGGTLGVRLYNKLELAGRSEGIVFRTTLALRYAAGVGRAGSMDFSLRDLIDIQTHTAPAHVHELHAYLGSSLSY